MCLQPLVTSSPLSLNILLRHLPAMALVAGCNLGSDGPAEPAHTLTLLCDSQAVEFKAWMFLYVSLAL
jgi:hypothetical protein